MTSFLQQLLDPLDSGFPALLLFATEAFKATRSRMLSCGR
jgi:hypothetical protein